MASFGREHNDVATASYPSELLQVFRSFLSNKSKIQTMVYRYYRNAFEDRPTETRLFSFCVLPPNLMQSSSRRERRPYVTKW